MNGRLRQVVPWTLYIAVVLIAMFTIVSLVINVLAPTFFPETNISGFQDYINTFCVILSFLSVGLGIYSIWQASESGKQANEIMKSIQLIEREQYLSQDLMRVIANALDNGKTMTADNVKEGTWKPDNNIT